jgi:putative transposase
MNAPLPQAVQSIALDEIAKALGISKQAVAKRAAKQDWTYQEVTGRGGAKRLYPLATLPKAIQDALSIHQLDAHMAALPVPSVTVPVVSPAANAVALRDTGEALNQHQRDVELARDRLLQYIAAWPGSVAAAIDRLNGLRQTQTLPAPLQWAYDHAWDKPRKDNRLTLSTYNKWVQLKKQRGRTAPRKSNVKDMSVKPWHAVVLKLRQRPQGGTLTWRHRELLKAWEPTWGDVPSYDALRRLCVEKLSIIDQIKGRHTGSALRSHKLWIKRSAAGMKPWQEVHADGWNTHFKAPHPVTGEFVTYEVWHFHDVATRYVSPPGLGMRETYEVVSAGLERCIRVGGVPSILQTDSTKVIKNSPRFTADEFASLADRAGFVVVHPKEVGNSQAGQGITGTCHLSGQGHGQPQPQACGQAHGEDG